jgi:segregation and condensation protein A
MSRQQEKTSLAPAGLATPVPLRVESPTFEGSLATLFHLARDGRVDLSGIPLAPVCIAYCEYIREMPEDDVDAAGAALLALAYLVERKAWSLLPIADPPPPEEIAELPEPTAHEFAMAVDSLEERHRERSQLFFRQGESADSYEVPMGPGSVSAAELAKAFERILLRAKPVEVERLAKHRPSLADVMKESLRRIREAGSATIEALLPSDFTRLDVVFVFLAVLELLRIGQVRAAIAGDELSLTPATK